MQIPLISVDLTPQKIFVVIDQKAIAVDVNPQIITTRWPYADPPTPPYIYTQSGSTAQLFNAPHQQSGSTAKII